MLMKISYDQKAVDFVIQNVCVLAEQLHVIIFFVIIWWLIKINKTRKTTIKIPWKQKRPQKRYAIKLSIE